MIRLIACLSKVSTQSIRGVLGGRFKYHTFLFIDLSSTRSAPQPNWVTRTSETFLRGQEARIKCIFSGK